MKDDISRILTRPRFVNFKPCDFPSSSDFDVVELKYDGIWGQVLIEGDQWEIWSRNGLLKKYGTAPFDLSRTLLHSEYLFGSEWAKDRPSMYEKCIVFGAEYINGELVTGVSNLSMRAKLLELLSAYDFSCIRGGLELTEQYPIKDALRLWEEKVKGEQYEGLVFKNSSSRWGDPFGRMKAETTADYVCIGFKESDSDTYMGWGVACVIGGLYDGDELVKICKVSGLTNDLRKEFFDHPDKYVGRVFEAEGKKISKKGALRHPNFLRWRDDKPATDCVVPSKQ